MMVIAMILSGYVGWRCTATKIAGWTSFSPDKRHRIEFYRVWSLSGLFFTAPGSGSDNIDGFIRLYRADGTLLEETYRSFLRSDEPFWTEDCVYFLGDGPSWPLAKSIPGNSSAGLRQVPD